ncbi:MAG: metalloregulator ArsR/SmtB family transcription factor [Sedimentisphaerales bacterium]|jgi:ArsR family transcriptional regulator
MKKSVESLSKIFTALSSGSRLGILMYIYDKQRLCNGKALRCQEGTCIKVLAKAMGISVPTASHHIKELVNAGLVTREKKGKWVYCAINTKAFENVTGFLGRWSAKGA